MGTKTRDGNRANKSGKRWRGACCEGATLSRAKQQTLEWKAAKQNKTTKKTPTSTACMCVCPTD